MGLVIVKRDIAKNWREQPLHTSCMTDYMAWTTVPKRKILCNKLAAAYESTKWSEALGLAKFWNVRPNFG